MAKTADDHPAVNVSQPQTKHLIFLDSLRALAASYVLFHHVFTIGVAPAYQFFTDVPPIVNKIVIVTAFGHIAVAFFIVLSGFSLMLAVLKRKQAPPFADFLKRRARRILPPYLAAVILPILLHFATGGRLLQPAELGVRSLVAHLLLVQDMFPDTYGSINSVLWSISVEWRIYLLFPFFAYLYLRYGIRVVLAATAVAFAIALTLCKALHLEQVYNHTGICPQYLLLFGFGMACAALRYSDAAKYAPLQQRLERLPWRWAWLIIPLAFAVFFAKQGFIWKLGRDGVFLYDIIVGLFGSATLLAASYRSHTRNLLNNQWLARVGLMAYSIYLIHYPILQLAALLAHSYVASNTASLVLMYTVGIAAAFGCACLFYRFIERPFAIPTGKTKSAKAN